jgi:hypothetical protein
MNSTDKVLNPGDLNGADIEALAFIVLMDASNSAQEDLKAIMDGVKAINQAKQKLRELMTAAAINILSSARRDELDERQLRVLAIYLMNPR